jgi:hypothetical protein
MTSHDVFHEYSHQVTPVGTLEKRDVRLPVRTRLHNHEILSHAWEYGTMTKRLELQPSFNSRSGTPVDI